VLPRICRRFALTPSPALCSVPGVMSKGRDGDTRQDGKDRAGKEAPATGEDRQARLARQLRANLRKRKAQQRRRKAPEGQSGGDGEGG
jgi:hypothetical protein